MSKQARRDENPYCMRCSKHLGLPFHETNEHDEAAERGELHAAFDAITREIPPSPESEAGA